MSVPSPARRLAVTFLAPFPWALFFFQLLLIVPRSARLFAEMGLKLPDLTQFLVDLSGWARGHLVATAVIAFALLGGSMAAAYGAQTANLSRARRVGLLFLIFGLPTALFILAWVGVQVPQSRLAEGFAK
jgi:type II secretory pathway component PulF